jgi:tellurite resistance protein
METAIARLRAPEKWSGSLSEIVGNIPASYFGIVLGLAGLGNAWRGAERTYQLPKFIEDWIYLPASSGRCWSLSTYSRRCSCPTNC